MESDLLSVVISTRDHVVLSRNHASLWCSKQDGRIRPGKGEATVGLSRDETFFETENLAVALVITPKLIYISKGTIYTCACIQLG